MIDRDVEVVDDLLCALDGILLLRWLTRYTITIFDLFHQHLQAWYSLLSHAQDVIDQDLNDVLGAQRA